MKSSFDSLLLGDAPAFRSVTRAAHIVAQTDVTVLLLGESGTGKELMARAIHDESRRHSAPFITINCAALPEGLAESELFGHKRGAFTGAASDKAGRIEAATGGTLFLDEIGELPLSIQAKLLRFLESGECQRVGDTACNRVDTRIIAATHRDLHQMVKEGRFREDLYYRLNVVPLELPPLRERFGDIPRLLSQFSKELANRHQLPAPRFSPEAMQLLEHYGWPGNVRELRNLAERMVVLFAGNEIEPGNLPLELRERSRFSRNIVLPESGLQLEEVERDLLCQALDRAHGNRSRAARLLGLSRDTFLYRLKKYAIG